MSGIMFKRFFLFLVCVLFAGFAASIGYAQSERKGVEAALSADTETVLSSRLGGYIYEITVGEGESFSNGQDLVIFDCEMHEAEKKRVATSSTQTREDGKGKEKARIVDDELPLVTTLPSAQQTFSVRCMRTGGDR